MNNTEAQGIPVLLFIYREALTFTPRPSLKNIQAILSSGQDKAAEESSEKLSESKYGFTRGAEYYGGKK